MDIWQKKEHFFADFMALDSTYRSQPPTFLDNLYYLVEKYTESKFTVYTSVCFEKTRLVRRH